MTDRIVTAVLVLTDRTGAPHPRETLAALRLQTRRPDRVIAVTAARGEKDLEDLLADSLSSGEVDEVLRTPGDGGVSAAVREVLDHLAADAAPAERSGATASDPVPEPTDEPRHGRRQRAVDPEHERRRLLREAADEASIPVRLRKDPGTPGSRATARRAAQDEDWIWFLEQDSAPAQGALAALLDQAAGSPTTAVIGPKHVRHRPGPGQGDESDDRLGRATDAADRAPEDEERPHDRDDVVTAEDADGLVDVGLSLTHGGRIVTGVDAGEIDQGQSDWREDVLAVSFSGMLVRKATLHRLNGLDPALDTPWAEIDFCRRTWRSGERVAIATAARAIGRPPEIAEADDAVGHRRGQLLAVLAYRPLPLALLSLLWLPVLTLARMAGAIITHRPRRVGVELLAWLRAMAAAPRVIRRGMRASRRSRVPRRRLAPLMLPRGADLRRKLDDLWTRAFADDERSRRIRRTTWGIAGTSHGADDADYGRHVTWTLLVVLLSLVGGALLVRPLFGRGSLVGPGLSPLPQDWRETAQAAWSGWIPGGLGARGPADPLVRLLGHLPVPGPLLVEVIVLGAVPLSALIAWFAAGALTRAVGARLALTLAWAAAPPLLAGLIAGDWPLLLVHLLLPLLGLAIARAIGLVHKVSQASVAAAAAAGLLLLVIGAVQPVLVILVAVVLALLAPLAPGRRLRLLWVLVPSLALHAPYLPQYLGHPRTLLAVAGDARALDPATPLELLALWPDAAPSWDVLAPLVGSGAAAWIPLLVLAPFALAAVLAPFLASVAGRAGRLSLLVVALGLAVTLGVRTVPVRVAGESGHPAPLNALLSLTLLALLLAAGASFDALARRSTRTSSIRRSSTSVLAGALALCCLVTVAGWTVSLPGLLDVHPARSSPIPAAATDPGLSESRSRVLVLEGSGTEDDAISASLVVDGGDSMLQHSALQDARVLARGGSAEDPAAAAVLQGAADLVATGTAPSPQALRSLAVAYVALPGGSAEDPGLSAALDGSPLLAKVTENSRVALWRVVDDAPRVSVADADAEDIADGTELTPVPSREITVEDAPIRAADSPRTLLLSERYDTEWTARVDGKTLTPVRIDGWQQAWRLPAGTSGDLEIDHRPRFTPVLRIGLYAVVVVTALVAVPWRSRPRTPEGRR